MVNVGVSVKSIIYVKKKNYIWNPTTCSCENGKYLASIIDNSVITCDEIIDAEATISHKKMEIRTPCPLFQCWL